MLSIRHLTPKDRPAWERLYEGYAIFYKVTQTPEMRNKVWSWLSDGSHGVEGVAAFDEDGTMLGIAHFRPFARPLSATVGGFLDDLFVEPTYRGRRIAEALLGHLKVEGARRGWSVIRWITAEDNHRARAVYDRVADATKWVTYDIKL